MLPRLIPPLLLSTLVGCGVPPVGVPDGPTDPGQAPDQPLLLTIASGSDGQSALAGDALPRLLVVKVTSGGEPVAGLSVGWATSDGLIGTLDPVTDPSGNARARWVLGAQDGIQRARFWITSRPQATVTLSATAWPRVRVSHVALLAGSSAPVATEVTLRVQAVGDFDNRPRAGVPVSWSGDGGFNPGNAVTDADGFAVTRWTLRTRVGPNEAHATVRGGPGAPPIRINSTPGPAASLTLLRIIDTVGTDWVIPIVADAYAKDAYDNLTPGPIEWTVEGEGIALHGVGTGPHTAQGRAEFRATGLPGTSRVRVSLPSTGASYSHDIVAVPDYRMVQLASEGTYRFVSARNGTSPAIDTVTAGTRLRWWLTPYDYEDHTIRFSGGPGTIPPGSLPYGFPSMFSTDILVAGTYTYVDDLSSATGTVVVMP